MRLCEACGRDFRQKRRSTFTCPYCGFNTNPRARSPRSKASLDQIEQQRQERQEQEQELREYLDISTD